MSKKVELNGKVYTSLAQLKRDMDNDRMAFDKMVEDSFRLSRVVVTSSLASLIVEEVKVGK